jgi:hypothetical protein
VDCFVLTVYLEYLFSHNTVIERERTPMAMEEKCILTVRERSLPLSVR